MEAKSSVRRTPRGILRVLAFKSSDWGFTDASLPKLRAMIGKLEAEGADVRVRHDALVVRVYGEQGEERLSRARSLLEEALRDPDFAGFSLGFAEGAARNAIDELRISGSAFKDAKRV